MRNNNPKPDDVNKPTLDALSNLTGVPVPEKINRDKKNKFLEDTMDWLRNNEPKVEEIDEPDLEKLANLADIPVPKTGKLTGPQKEVLDEVVDWLRKNDPKDEDVDKPTMDALSSASAKEDQ